MTGFFERRRQAKEINRDVKFKQGLSRVRNYVKKCQASQKKYWELGKRALSLGDRQQFENVVKAYILTGETANRWERYLVAMETVAVQKDQVKATGEFAKSMSVMSESIMAGAKPEDITRVQVDLERALTKAQTLEETLAAVMDASNDTIFSSEGLTDTSLQDIESAMKMEISQVENDALDNRIATGLSRIEEEMKKEIK